MGMRIAHLSNKDFRRDIRPRVSADTPEECPYIFTGPDPA